MFRKEKSYSHLARGRTGWWTALVAVLLTTIGFAHDGQLVSSSDQRAGSRTRTGTQPSREVRQTVGRASLPAVAQSHISSAIGKDQEVYHAAQHAAGLRFENPDHSVSASFTSAGVRFHLGTNQWALTLRGHGYGDRRLDAEAVAPTANANRVEYQRGALTEWYVNGPLGLEQGFTLQEAPGRANGPLTLAFAVAGDLEASIDPGARDLTLSKHGAAAFRYAGLRAWDADRRELRTWLEMAGKELRLHVDDSGARYPVTIDPVVQAVKLVAQTTIYGAPVNDGVAGDQLGRSIAISDDGSTVVVGAPFKRLNNIRSGVAYVFVRPSEMEGGWNSVTPMNYANRLQASDFATSGLTFGMSVAVSADGGTIVVGAPGPNQATYQGAAYVYVRMIGYWGGGWALAQTAKLTPFNATGFSNFGGFGTAVSIADDGATIIVGSPNRSDLNGSYPDGAVHAFFRPASGWLDMTQSATISGLAATNQLINTRFGSSVSLSGDRWFLVVGSPGEFEYRGAAYLFMLSSAGGTLHYAKLAKFYKNDGGPYESFGSAVAINTNGSNFAVSAPGAPVAGRTQGAILVYERPAIQLDWILKARLTMANGVEDDALGSSLSMSGDGNTIVAGSPHYPGLSSGATYVFVKPVGGWINSTENAKLQSDDIIAGDNFGHAAAVSADGATWAVAAPFATVGFNARQGAAYMFTGIADNPVAAVNPSSLTFGPAEDGQNPGPQTVTLTNAGAGPLIVTGVSATGQFTSTQNCVAASPIVPGSSCTEQVAFVPVSTALTTGTLTFTDNSTGVAGSTQTVALQGYGIKVNTSTAITAVSANPVLAGQPVNVSVAVTPQSGAMATPSGTVTVLASTGESCTTTAPSGSCALTFPTAADRTLTATYNGDTTFKPSTSTAASVKVVDFRLSVSPASQTVQGRKATYVVTVTGLNGFAGTVALTCSGGPANTTCAMSPQSLTLPSATTTSKATVTLPTGTVPSGTYVISFTGSFGGVNREVKATLVKPATLAK